MKRRDAMRRLAGAAAGLGAGAVLAGNIEPGRRLYGTPETLRFRRPGEENLLRLALAREEVPTGVWEETCALAQLAARVVEQPGEAQAFGRDPAAAFRALGYDLSNLSLDEPEVRACLLLADEDVRQAIARGEAQVFIQALRDRGIEPDPETDRLAHAFRQALQHEAALGLRAQPADDPFAPSLEPTMSIIAITFAIVFAVALAVVLVAVETLVYVGSSGEAPGRHKSSSRTWLSTLALQSGNAELARQVRERLVDETSLSMADAVVEAAAARGLAFTREEAVHQVRSAYRRFIR